MRRPSSLIVLAETRAYTIIRRLYVGTAFELTQLGSDSPLMDVVLHGCVRAGEMTTSSALCYPDVSVS